MALRAMGPACNPANFPVWFSNPQQRLIKAILACQTEMGTLERNIAAPRGKM